MGIGKERNVAFKMKGNAHGHVPCPSDAAQSGTGAQTLRRLVPGELGQDVCMTVVHSSAAADNAITESAAHESCPACGAPRAAPGTALTAFGVKPGPRCVAGSAASPAGGEAAGCSWRLPFVFRLYLVCYSVEVYMLASGIAGVCEWWVAQVLRICRSSSPVTERASFSSRLFFFFFFPSTGFCSSSIAISLLRCLGKERRKKNKNHRHDCHGLYLFIRLLE